MFFKNCFPIITCDEVHLNIKEVKLSQAAKEFVDKNTQIFSKTSVYDVVTIMFGEMLKTSLIAGFIENPEKDYVFFDGCSNAFVPSLRGLGRISVDNIIKRKNKLSPEDWAKIVQDFMRNNLDFVESILMLEPERLKNKLIKNEDWIIFMAPEITFDEFLNTFLALVIIHTKEHQKENLRN